MPTNGTYSVSPPPTVQDGMYLSASLYNQMVDYLNGITDFVYGANIPRFRWKFGTSIPGDMVWMMQRRYNQLAIYGNFTPTGATANVEVWLGHDDVTFYKVHDVDYAAGMRTITVDLSALTGDNSIALDSIYFIKIIPTGISDCQIERIEERGASVLTKPYSPATLGTNDIITATYLNQTIANMKVLGFNNYPYNRCFQAPAMRDRTLEDGANGIFEWRINRVNRYLHIGFKTGSSGGGTDAWRININGTRLLQGSNDNLPRDYVVDLQGMTTANGYLNNITAPTVGAEYSINLYVEQAGVLPANGFRMNYMWELPFAT